MRVTSIQPYTVFPRRVHILVLGTYRVCKVYHCSKIVYVFRTHIQIFIKCTSWTFSAFYEVLVRTDSTEQFLPFLIREKIVTNTNCTQALDCTQLPVHRKLIQWLLSCRWHKCEKRSKPENRKDPSTMTCIHWYYSHNTALNFWHELAHTFSHF